MRKTLLPMFASLALCGAATIALLASTARAEQQPKRPLMVAMTGPAFALETAAPPGEGGGPDMMDRPGMMGGSREGMKAMCRDMLARQTGELAFLETKLALSPAQAPLYARWKNVMLDIAQRHQAECGAAARAGARHDLMDGMAMEERLLRIRLADLEAQRPALSALYGALNPEQKAELAQAARHKMEGRMHRMMGMMDRRGRMENMMDHPPMDRGPDGPGGPPPR